RASHRKRWKTMTLTPHEFIRRFLSHVLPKGFHRIRHYGLFANGSRAANIARARALLNLSAPTKDNADNVTATEPDETQLLNFPCPCCGGRMIIIEVFAAGMEPKHRPSPEAIDSS
ncbi:MAG: transposase, partial [Hyphomicrobiaceae bacterium]